MEKHDRYKVRPVPTPHGPTYIIVDTATGERVRAYDCQIWAEHEADAMNGHSDRLRAPRLSRSMTKWLSACADIKTPLMGRERAKR